jgi:hypothetical protein
MVAAELSKLNKGCHVEHGSGDLSQTEAAEMMHVGTATVKRSDCLPHTAALHRRASSTGVVGLTHERADRGNNRPRKHSI